MIDKGAHFYRCDFQVHTPRDTNWGGAEAKTEEERLEFGKNLILACRAKGLRGLAITDHHDLLMFAYVRRAAREELDDQGQPIAPEDQIVVFPGMELTLSMPCQALLIFDADLPSDIVSTIPVALGITATPASESKLPQVKKIDHLPDPKSVYDRLNQHESLRGKFIVCPNVTDNGHKTLLRKGFDSHYRQMPCVGGYLDGSVTSLGDGNKNIIAGKNRDYGFKEIAVFQTSDCRNYDFKQLGLHSSWVKWAVPTAEALRQACLAKESRIFHTEPSLPPVRITALHVSNSKFLGPIDLAINGQYTALIGGRGTGKSTVLEYLRWGLCDQPPEFDEEETELPDYQRRRASLIEKTLAELGSTVTVEFTLNGVPHVVRRSTKGDVLLKIGDQEFRPSTEEEIRSLFPIHAYSQKQLSNVGVRSEELSRFIQQPIQKDLDTVDSELSKISVTLRRTYESRIASEKANIEKAQLETEVTSVNERIKALRESLEGLSEDDQKIIEAQAEFEAQNSIVELWRNDIESLTTLTEEISNSASELPTALEETSDEFLVDTYSPLKKTFDEYKSALDIAATKLNADLQSDFYKKIESWESKRTAHLTAYEGVQTRSKANENTINQVRQLEDRLRQVQSKVAELASRIKRYESELKQFDDAITEYFMLLKKRNLALRQQCQRLTSLSKGYIKAELKEAGSQKGSATVLKDFAKGTKIRTEKFDAVFEKVSKANDPLDAWKDVLFDIEKLARTTPSDNERIKLPATNTLDIHDFNEQEKTKLATKISPNNWIELLLSPLESQPIFKYRSREQEYIDFNDASAGQQATALMHVLLNQDGPPLIIDQPEDDLDSNIIDQVCSEIWSAKTKRQLVFSSHNANLVVNGDAELVISCDYRIAGDQSGGKIANQGAIDVDEVRKTITKIMEGGEKAFGLRRQKYGF